LPDSLTRARELELAEALGDTPLTAIDVHQLERGRCTAYLAGELPRFGAAVIRSLNTPDEPALHGPDPGAAWSILRELGGWSCVNVPELMAGELVPLMEREIGGPLRQVGDIYHVLSQVRTWDLPGEVRSFATGDLGLLGEAEEELSGIGFDTMDALISEGAAAGAVVEGRVVSLAHTYALTPGHADIGVGTLKGFRRLGYASAAGALVARSVLSGGRIPCWSTGENNDASRSTARRIGFSEVGRRVYLVPPRPVSDR
jgi:hypothetical protein